MMSTNIWTEFLLQFQKQREDSAILLASNRPQQQWQDKETKKVRKGKEKLKERTNRERLVGLQKAPHLQDMKQNHSENAKSGNSKQEFFFKKQPSSPL
jgi:hypothetical protein